MCAHPMAFSMFCLDIFFRVAVSLLFFLLIRIFISVSQVCNYLMRNVNNESIPLCSVDFRYFGCANEFPYLYCIVCFKVMYGKGAHICHLLVLADNPISIFFSFKKGTRTFNSICMNRCMMATVNVPRIQCKLLFAGAKTPHEAFFINSPSKLNCTSFEIIDSKITVVFS